MGEAGGGGGWGTPFFAKPLEFLGFCFTHGNSKQNKALPLEVYKIVLHHTDPEILRPKTKTPGSSTCFFLDHS